MEGNVETRKQSADHEAMACPNTLHNRLMEVSNGLLPELPRRIT